MDKETFSHRVLTMERTLYCIARSMLPPDDCQDAVQSAVLRAWERLKTLREEAAFEVWLMRILTRECYAIRRERKQSVPIGELSESLLASARDTAREYELTDALNALRPEDRLLILLHHDKGYSLSQVSHITGIPQGVLKMRLHRARVRLRNLLEEDNL